MRSMDFEKTLAFVQEEWKHLQKNNPELYADIEKCIYAQATKLGEEVGELNEALLAHFGRQRQGKKDKQTSVGEEMADVIMVVMLIATGLGISVTEAIEKKVGVIEARRTTHR